MARGLNVVASPSQGGSSCYLLDSKEANFGFQAAELVESEERALCVIFTWKVDTNETQGLMGYLVEFSQTELHKCRLIWIPCEGCGGPTSLVGHEITPKCSIYL